MMPPEGAWRIDRSLIHRSAWKKDSAKFALTEFSEVRMAPAILGYSPKCLAGALCEVRGRKPRPSTQPEKDPVGSPKSPGARRRPVLGRDDQLSTTACPLLLDDPAQEHQLRALFRGPPQK